jgi:hypothetical protein
MDSDLGSSRLPLELLRDGDDFGKVGIVCYHLFPLFVSQREYKIDLF